MDIHTYVSSAVFIHVLFHLPPILNTTKTNSSASYFFCVIPSYIRQFVHTKEE